MADKAVPNLNETACAVLRTAVLETRPKLRNAWKKLQEAESQVESCRLIFHDLRNQIANLQEAVGDPIEIDPSLPEIK